VLGLGSARRSGLRTAAFLFAAMAVAIFGTAVAVNTFTWRYQLVLVILLPPAGVLGIAALVGGRLREGSARTRPGILRPASESRSAGVP
jgi:hypothetical protein